MGLILKKRHLIVATLVVALSAAIFVNWYYTKPQTKTTSAQTEYTTVITDNVNVNESTLGDAQLVSGNNSYFTQAKLKRNEAHDEALEALNDIIKDSNSSESAITVSQKDLAEISKNIKLEADIENLVTAKTGSECLVIINNDKIEVIVAKGVMNDTVSTQITDIIITQNEKFSENITIIETK